ncbi:hypothetical protein CDQ84_11620 [Clostridium thermosuccinogenes]|uniref:Uncharacterized protein n=1 Tax=Clostridium thermosuccinogenes TaxID=84032 RepID=A0A2K2FCH5_9CLOT|nr:hypothetical protein CDO33_18420 [Pseudoclostridium thermosuccinogenes]PNT96481.1 hypothetical protein CDQ85_11625 [Pseudoclostridium thermosuccinogenes]PNT98139.1 hypothetical protein CDQ84_11620 [Pseudoclostridium thermosuccinogenes]
MEARKLNILPESGQGKSKIYKSCPMSNIRMYDAVLQDKPMLHIKNPVGMYKLYYFIINYP